MSLHEYAGFIAEKKLIGLTCGDIAAALCTQFGTRRGFFREKCAEMVC